MEEFPMVSVVIRTHDEIHLIETLITKINEQDYNNFEIIVVDSGSTDGTVEVAKRLNARVVQIKDEDFTFGYSLNVGCRASEGEILAFISGHCFPVDKNWISKFVKNYADETVGCVFGGQKGNHSTKYAEERIFSQYYGKKNKMPYEGAFCNNANNSIRKSIWEKIPFDESLTGLEDIDWNLRMHKMGYKSVYNAEAEIYHIHTETWKKIRHRFRREAVAMKNMFPKHTMPFLAMINLMIRAIFLDSYNATVKKQFTYIEIIKYRYNQYLGAYLGFKYMEDRPLPQRVYDQWTPREPISNHMHLSSKNQYFLIQSFLIFVLSIFSLIIIGFNLTGMLILFLFLVIWIFVTTKPKETIDLDDLSYSTIFNSNKSTKDMDE